MNQDPVRREGRPSTLRPWSIGRCLGLIVVAAAALGFASTSSAAGGVTTVDLSGVGPEATTVDFGVQHPRQFDYAPIPVGFTAIASDVVWQHWGASSTIGTGRIQFCANMSPCFTGGFSIRLYDRRFVSCGEGRSHFGYTRATLNVTKERVSRPVIDTILVGC